MFILGFAFAVNHLRKCETAVYAGEGPNRYLSQVVVLVSLDPPICLTLL